MRKPPTPKQKKFQRYLIRTGCPTEAAMQSFDCKNRRVASVIGCRLVKKLDISFIDLMEQMGLDDVRDVEDLKFLRNCEDKAVRLKAIELCLKIKGRLKERDLKINLEVNLPQEIQSARSRLENYYESIAKRN